jgi:hypothetical protein
MNGGGASLDDGDPFVRAHYSTRLNIKAIFCNVCASRYRRISRTRHAVDGRTTPVALV